MTAKHKEQLHDPQYALRFMERMKCQDIKDAEWPCNVITDVILSSDTYLQAENQTIPVITKDMLPSDIEGTLLYLFARLTFQENLFLTARYKEKFTLDWIANRYKTSRQYVSRTIQRAIRKIGVGEGDKMLQLGLRGYYESLMAKAAEDSNQNAYDHGYADGWNNAIRALMDSETAIAPQPITNDSQSIQLLGLSYRTIHYLTNAGITTIRDLLNTPGEDIMNIRNLGHTSCKEIFTRLKANGYNVQNKMALDT